MQKANIYQHIKYTTQAQIKVLFETKFNKEVRITLGKNGSISEHKTANPIVLEVLEGNLKFQVESTVHEMVKGDLLGLDGSIMHSLHATSDCLLRLTITKQDYENRMAEVSNNKE